MQLSHVLGEKEQPRVSLQPPHLVISIAKRPIRIQANWQPIFTLIYVIQVESILLSPYITLYFWK